MKRSQEKSPEGWILRDGSFIEVECACQVIGAQEILDRKGVAYTDVEQAVVLRGWIRVGPKPKDRSSPLFLYAGSLPPTNAQMTVLWDHCLKWRLVFPSLDVLWFNARRQTVPKGLTGA
jgi:hypothetical protein